MGAWLAGVGGFGKGLDQGREAALRRQYMAENVKQLLSQGEGREALAAALMGGGIPGLGGPPGGVAQPPMPGAPSMPAATGGAPAAPVQQPTPLPAPMAQPAPAPQPYAPQTPNPYGSAGGTFEGGAPQQPGAAPGYDMSETPADPAARVDAAQAAINQQAQQPAPAAAPPVAEPPAAPAAQAPTAETASVPVVGAGGQRFPDVSMFLNQLHPQQVMQAVMAARPGTSPQAAMYAVEQAMKLGQYGTAEEKLRVAYMMKMLGYDISAQRLAETTQHNRATETAAGARIGQADRKITQGDQRIEIAKQRLGQQQQQFQARLQQSKTMGDVGHRQAALRTLLGDVDRMITPSGMNAPPTGEEMAALQAQRREVINELRKLQGMSPMPAAPAAPAAR